MTPLIVLAYLLITMGGGYFSDKPKRYGPAPDHAEEKDRAKTENRGDDNGRIFRLDRHRWQYEKDLTKYIDDFRKYYFKIHHESVDVSINFGDMKDDYRIIGSGMVTKGAFATFSPSSSGPYRVANYFLEGFLPFQTNNIWEPLFTLSRKKAYQRDLLTYPGRVEVWQRSREAYFNPRGDCEDHAIALADWLIELGEDARVVLGKVNGEGHAWVVLFKNKKVFLLESTSKNLRMRRYEYPLATLHPEYKPYVMFNQKDTWYNIDAPNGISYTGISWVHGSHYTRDENQFKQFERDLKKHL